MAESDKPDNVYDGVHTAPVEDWAPKDPASIGPNGERPLEVGDSKHLFGSWSD